MSTSPACWATPAPPSNSPVWLALIVHLLSVLAAHARGLRRRSPALLRQCLVAALLLDAQDLAAARPAFPLQLALPFPSVPP